MTTHEENKKIIYKRDNWTGRILDENEEKNRENVFRIRHKIFAESLRWIKENPQKLDKDEYDKYSSILAIFKGNKILATVRIIDYSNPFMVEKDFLHLFSSEDEIVKNKGTVEISRLAVDPSLDKDLRHQTVSVLYQTIFYFIERNKINRIYLVTTEKYLNSLKRRFFLPMYSFEKRFMTHPQKLYYRAVLIDWENCFFLKRIFIFILLKLNKFR